jgi:uncharacterized protein YjbJ (UPF0337 family)
MSTEDKAKAVVKNAEGKGQEVAGAVTGNVRDEAAGKAKQEEAKVRDGVEDAKDEAREMAGKVRDGLEDAKDSIVDKAKQVAKKVHDGVEHAKDELKK